MLDQRPVDHRQHLLWHRLGRGQEPGAQTGHRENRFADRLHVGNRRRLWITGVSVTMWNRKKPQSDLKIIRRFTNVVNPLATICGPHKAFSCLGWKPVWVA